MKKVIILCLFLFANILIYSQIRHQVEFSIEPEIINEKLSNGENYSKVTIPETYKTYMVGQPSLPVKYIKLLIPYNADASDVIINNAPIKVFYTDYKIDPAQPPIPTSVDYIPQDFVKPSNSARKNIIQ
jgi:hypothetical protein